MDVDAAGVAAAPRRQAAIDGSGHGNAELAGAYGRPWRRSRHAVVPRRNRGGSLRDPEIGHSLGFVKAEIVPAYGFDGRDAVQRGTPFACYYGRESVIQALKVSSALDCAT